MRKSILVLSMGLAAAMSFHASAEDLEITHCYSGSGTLFSHGAIVLASWTQNGIVMSHHPKQLLHNAVVHCEGIQRGGGVTRTGEGLCRIVDEDGDAIIASIPYTGFDFDVKFLEGTGKWKGITGMLHSTRIARSQDGKGAMPGTYQGCRSERGHFELPK